MKIVRKSGPMADEYDIDDLVRKIKSEASNIPMPYDYVLSDFRHQKTHQDTSKTLLKLISKLVSNGKIAKKSLTLAQCIQQHVRDGQESKRNQTTLGLALKLHHKTGSSELICILHEHGITSSYHEVLRFRKSAASFASKNHAIYQSLLGLTLAGVTTMIYEYQVLME